MLFVRMLHQHRVEHVLDSASDERFQVVLESGVVDLPHTPLSGICERKYTLPAHKLFLLYKGNLFCELKKSKLTLVSWACRKRNAGIATTSSRKRYPSRGPLQVPETEDPIFANALDRLRVSRMNPELLKALEANMFDHHEYEALEAEAFLKGQANGLASGIEKGARQEREKNDAECAARDSKRADYLRSQNVPDSVISTMLSLK